MTKQASIRRFACVVALEIDIQRLPIEAAPERLVFAREVAEKLAAWTSRELSERVRGIEQVGLSLAGGGYNLHDLLRPGMPVFDALGGLYLGGQQGHFAPGLMAIGANDSDALPGQLPTPSELASPIFYLPLVLLGTAAQLEPLQELLDEILFEQAGAQPPALAAMEEIVALPIAHAGVMTLDDLSAVTRMQFAQMGLESAWDVVDQVVFGQASAGSFRVAEQVDCEWRDQRLLIDWAGRPGQAEAFAAWFEALRRLWLLAQQHGLRPALPERAPDIEGLDVDGCLWMGAPPAGAVEELRLHESDEHGPIAISLRQGRDWHQAWLIHPEAAQRLHRRLGSGLEVRSENLALDDVGRPVLQAA